jgi:2'-5' RNA ligase
LTIREPNEWSSEQLQLAVIHLEKITASYEPFTVRFNRFSTFYPASNVIYMAMEEPEPFSRLYETICSGPLHEENTLHRYNPHLTIGQQLSSDELHDVYASLRKIKIDFQVKVDRVHLLYQTENQAWTAHQTFLLRG